MESFRLNIKPLSHLSHYCSFQLIRPVGSLICIDQIRYSDASTLIMVRVLHNLPFLVINITIFAITKIASRNEGQPIQKHPNSLYYFPICDELCNCLYLSNISNTFLHDANHHICAQADKTVTDKKKKESIFSL